MGFCNSQKALCVYERDIERESERGEGLRGVGARLSFTELGTPERTVPGVLLLTILRSLRIAVRGPRVHPSVVSGEDMPAGAPLLYTGVHL